MRQFLGLDSMYAGLAVNHVLGTTSLTYDMSNHRARGALHRGCKHETKGTKDIGAFRTNHLLVQAEETEV